MKKYYEEKRTAQRQHINLSTYAYKILQADAMSFIGSQNISGLINSIFLNYYLTAEASISRAVENRRAAITNDILEEKYLSQHPEDPDLKYYSHNNSLDENEEDVISTILNGYARHLAARVREYPKQQTLKIRLQNEVFDIIYPGDSGSWLEEEYYKTPSDYLKALLEEYSRKCYFDREEIFSKNILEDFNNEISAVDKDKRIMTITYSPLPGNSRKYNIKPYFLTDRSPSEYHYLVALACPADLPKQEYKIGVFRVSWIEKLIIHPRSFGSGKLTRAQAAYLEQEIESKGVPYISDEIANTRDYVIKLSPMGLKKYYNIAHLRPLYDGQPEILEDGSALMHFRATFRQMHHYFFKLGKDARILEPADSAELFRQEYLESWEAYKKG